MMQNILNLWEQVDDNQAAMYALSQATGLKLRSIQNNWFGRFPDVPEVHQKITVEVLQKIVAKQNAA